MTIFSSSVQRALADSDVDVFFVSREASKWWNAQRRRKQADVIALLGGWYWSLAHEEAGPFRTKSAALRDVYYRRIVRLRPPLMDPRELREARAPEPETARAWAVFLDEPTFDWEATDMQDAFVKCGLAKWRPATAEDIASANDNCEVQINDTILALTDAGRAAIAAVREP